MCGEIFDASLETCPVCGVGKENFVPVSDTGTPPQRKDTTERFLILGGGTAGYQAAKAVRERNATAVITLVTNEDAFPYNRTKLTKQLLSALNDKEITLSPKAWYAEQRIQVMTGCTVTAIHPDKKQVTTADGRTLAYDKLIYALGATCFVPPVPGADLPHVVTIRNLADTKRVLALSEHAKEAVVIGGGVLGLEAAWELKQAGLQVTVLEVLPHIMSRQLDEDTSSLLAGKVRSSDVTLLEGVQVTAIEAGGVRLQDGMKVPGQLVVFSCGVRANAALAEAAGVAVDKGITVNNRMETSQQNIYACGDCARFNGVSYALWEEASIMGKVAGANAAGEALLYETVAPVLTFHGMNTALYALGDCGNMMKCPYVIIKIEDDEHDVHERYFFLHGKMVGAALLGHSTKVAKVTQFVMEGAGVDAILR